MRIYRLAWFVPLVLVGCAGSLPPSPSISHGEALLESYSPKQVWLVEINVNVTVPEPFDEGYKQQSYQTEFYELRAGTGSSSPTLIADSTRHLWLVQENDTVVYGTYSLQSNKHAIFEEYLSVNEQGQAGFLFLGGLDFHLIPEGEHMALAFFGPHTAASIGFSLSFDERPILRIAGFNHTSRFPMSHAFDIVYEERNVTATIHLKYWGRAQFSIDEQRLEQLRDHPEDVDFALNQYESDFLPGGRIGQTSAFCIGAILRTPAPCMMQWERPLV